VSSSLPPRTALAYWAEPLRIDPERIGLTRPERDRMNGLHRDDDRRRFGTGRALLRLAAATWTGQDVADIVVTATCAECGGPHGRPVLSTATGPLPVHASIAHAHDRVVVAVARCGPIGVDVEPTGQPLFADFDSVALTPAERRRVQAVEAVDAERRRIWVRKEALLKRRGTGLNQSPDTVEAAAADTRFVDLDLGRDYLAALALPATATGPVDVSPARADLAAWATSARSAS
jgi:4'-phosphopantetheinyl transferase